MVTLIRLAFDPGALRLHLGRRGRLARFLKADIAHGLFPPRARHKRSWEAPRNGHADSKNLFVVNRAPQVHEQSD